MAGDVDRGEPDEGSEEEATSQGWALATLGRSLSTTFLLGLAVYQAVMVATILVSSEAEGRRLELIAAHAVVSLVLIAAHRGRLDVWVAAMAINAVTLWDWSVAESVDGAFCLAAAWQLNAAQLLPALLMRGWKDRACSAVIGAAVPLALAVIHPDWMVLVTAAVVTGATIRSVGRLGRRALERLAERVDAEFAESERVRGEVEAARTIRRASAEQVRVLHDTVVNTLAAVASGGGATRDPRLVRDRCARDAEVADAVLAGRSTPALADDLTDLEPVAAELGIVLERRGMSDDRLTAALRRVSDDAVRGLAGAVREALLNVAKHAGTDHAVVRFESAEGMLEVVVEDQGQGFDGRAVPGRGLQRSVIDRAEDAGIEVGVRSAPAEGTRLRFRAPLGATDLASESDQTRVSIDAIRTRASWLWAGGVVGVGIVIEAVNRFGMLTPTYGMVAIGAIGLGLSWWDVQRSDRVTAPTTLLLVLAVPAGFVSALAGVDFGRTEPIQWQAIGVTAPMILLLVHTHTPFPRIAASIGLVAAALATAFVARRESADLATVIIVGTVPPLGVAAAWSRFERALREVGDRLAAAAVAAADATAERARRDAAARASARWRDAGLTRCVSLLRDVAAGSVEPTSDEARRAAADEEEYLRQVILLDPELVHLGTWFARALALARDRGVHLRVRAGRAEPEESSAAAALGHIVFDVVGAAPAGSEVVVTVLGQDDSLRLGIVGPTPTVVACAADWTPPADWSAELRTLGDVDLLEAVGPIRRRTPAGAIDR